MPREKNPLSIRIESNNKDMLYILKVALTEWFEKQNSSYFKLMEHNMENWSAEKIREEFEILNEYRKMVEVMGEKIENAMSKT